MSLNNALSGLGAATTNLGVISHNIANANTVGFKGSRAMFSDLYPGGGNSRTVGIGVQAATVQQQFKQGNLLTTNNPLDVAIMGGGFFALEDPQGRQVFSRNGSFTMDRSGFFIDPNGSRLIGANGLIQIRDEDKRLTPVATTEARLQLNLNSAVEPPPVAPFNINDPDTYNFATSFTAFDSLGNPHQITLYFSRPDAATNDWQMRYVIDGGLPDTDPVAPGLQPTIFGPEAITFNADGIIQPEPFVPIVLDLGNPVDVGPGAPGPDPLEIELDLSGSTQYNAVSRALRQVVNGNGSADLDLINIEVTSSGVVNGRFADGSIRKLDEISLIMFANDRGLQPLGDTYWARTSASGPALKTPPGNGSAGVLKSGTLEQSNVDLTEELVSMITAQRHFQANAQVIDTMDQISQRLLNR